jgi:hypothetical protein
MGTSAPEDEVLYRGATREREAEELSRIIITGTSTAEDEVAYRGLCRVGRGGISEPQEYPMCLLESLLALRVVSGRTRGCLSVRRGGMASS